MIKIMLGNNFDEKLIDNVIDMNKKYKKSQVTEMFGSTTSTFYNYTARPLYRLPDINLEETLRIKKKLDDNNILFNLTMNGPNIDKTKFNANEFISDLKEWNIKRITVTNTLLLEVLQEADLDIEIELSTIYHINTIPQMYMLLERYPKIKKVCMNLMRNRDMKFLKEFKKAFKHKIDIELILNEFCLWHCPNRNYCYLNHQNVYTADDNKLFKNYPMRDCIHARNTDFSEWLKTRFILPEWVKYYQDIGYEHFKITGRTSSTDFVTKVLKIYMDRFEGIENDYSFDELWYHLENIGKTKENEFTPNILKKIKYKHLEKYERYIYEEQNNYDIDNNVNDYQTVNANIKAIAEEILEEVNGDS